MTAIQTFTAPLGRFLLSLIFIAHGAGAWSLDKRRSA